MLRATLVEPALIPAVAALAGVALGLAGNWALDVIKDRRAGRKQRDAAIAELLAATADLMLAVRSIRALYEKRTTFRHYLWVTARLFAAVGGVIAGADMSGLPAPASGGTLRRARQSVAWFSDWRRAAPFFDRLVLIERDLGDAERTAVMDATSLLTPRTVRFYAAVAVLTLGADEKIASHPKRLVRRCPSRSRLTRLAPPGLRPRSRPAAGGGVNLTG